MSNKPKGVAIHPNNNISSVERAYNKFISNMVSFCKRSPFYGKHVGSKKPSNLKQRLIH